LFEHNFTHSHIAGSISALTPSSGPVAGGTTVTITAAQQFGSGSDITSVLFGNSQASILSQSSMMVTVISPLGAQGSTQVIVSSITFGSAVAAYIYGMYFCQRGSVCDVD